MTDTDNNKKAGDTTKFPPRRITMTQSQADKCQVEYERLLAEHSAKRVGPPNPMEYYTIKALWFRAYGADEVQIIADPAPDATAVPSAVDAADANVNS